MLGFFALFTGFSVAGAWQQLNSARQQTYAESRALTEVYWVAKGLPDPDRAVVRQRVREYTRDVVSDEWAQMQKGRGSAVGWQALDQVRVAVDGARVTVPTEIAVKNEVMRNLTDAYARRNTRLADVRAAVPEVVLAGLFVGAIFVVATPPVIGLTANARNLVLMGFLGACVAFGVSLVVELSGPYSGLVRLQATAFELAQVRYDQIDARMSSS
ncbi:bestrophin-like domain [Kitasatospora sp. P5_F3]